MQTVELRLRNLDLATSTFGYASVWDVKSYVLELKDICRQVLTELTYKYSNKVFHSDGDEGMRELFAVHHGFVLSDWWPILYRCFSTDYKKLYPTDLSAYYKQLRDTVNVILFEYNYNLLDKKYPDNHLSRVAYRIYRAGLRAEFNPEHVYTYISEVQLALPDEDFYDVLQRARESFVKSNKN